MHVLIVVIHVIISERQEHSCSAVVAICYMKRRSDTRDANRPRFSLWDVSMRTHPACPCPR